MLSLEEAKENIFSKIFELPVERIPAGRAIHRIAGENILSPISLPLFDNSAMDGYAVRAQDLAGARSEQRISLRCSGKIAAGKSSDSKLLPGECIRLFTGSVLPEGADAVVMQEDTGTENNHVLFHEPIRPWENIRLKGEDVKPGSVVVGKGQRIVPARAALLAACGIETVPVHRLPVIALVATGNELRVAGEELHPGEIYESNRTLLAGLLSDQADVRMLPIVPDDFDRTVEALQSAFEQSDLVITCGGVSVGEYDFVKAAFEKMGGAIELWKINIRPGKPFVFGQFSNKFLFGLPGNPVSSLVTFLVLGWPAIRKMSGAARFELPVIQGVLSQEIFNRGERRHFVRVRWTDGKVIPSGPQASHLIGNLGEANALLDVPPGAKLEQGSVVKVQIWQLPSE